MLRGKPHWRHARIHFCQQRQHNRQALLSGPAGSLRVRGVQLQPHECLVQFLARRRLLCLPPPQTPGQRSELLVQDTEIDHGWIRLMPELRGRRIRVRIRVLAQATRRRVQPGGRAVLYFRPPRARDDIQGRDGRLEGCSEGLVLPRI